jgi:hypothetical protein
MAEALARPEREAQTALQLNEDDGPMLEFLADNPLRGKAQAVPIEA